jgi:ABC-type multidrug transport system fused ATPase/permease subunit
MMGGVGGGGNWVRSSNAGDIDADGTKLYDSSVVARLAAYGKPFKRAILLSILGVVLYTAATVAIPRLIGIATDSAIISDDNKYSSRWSVRRSSSTCATTYSYTYNAYRCRSTTGTRSAPSCPGRRTMSTSSKSS